MTQSGDRTAECGVFLDGCLLLDLETLPPREGSTEHRLVALAAQGGRDPQRVWSRRGSQLRGRRLDETLDELARLAEGARYLLGHNLLEHDLPILARLAPDHPLLRLPVADTLYLSPLAFPENPYHRLVKDYKLVKEAVNDPLADARLAARVFEEQWLQLSDLAARRPGRLSFYGFCLEAIDSCRGGTGLASVFHRVAGEATIHPRQAATYVAQTFAEKACRTTLRQPDFDDRELRVAWAYAAAWLDVAESSSVLPPWVRRRFPRVVTLLDRLRNALCEAPDCTYCRRQHDTRSLLQRYFAFDDFRPKPQVAGSEESLQKAITQQGMDGKSLLAILPTGGGKSVCYQLPALVHHQRRGAVTIVISPLQALMKDQVDQLGASTGLESAAALYGLLTPPERGRVMERLRMGDLALLYVAPEQLRNRSFVKAIEQREIATWVFDEAHCLSKWGHDFRPDYLYAGRFIRHLAERQKVKVPPVACYTATAKKSVKEEVLAYFAAQLGLHLALFEAPGDRQELSFSVLAVSPAEKWERFYQCLGDKLAISGGSAVAYFNSRKRSVEGAQFLQSRGMRAAAFHAGMSPVEKRQVLEEFSSGAIPVVCATNAFGMGIDKSDVRIVVHVDIPGSLESYLQEAGRAGRDRKAAECVLLFEDHDLEHQFRLLAQSRLSQRDVQQILRGLRRAARQRRGELVLTSAELLRDDGVQTDFARDDWQADTKVKTAIAWLEKRAFVERTENRTRVFQGKLRVKNMQEGQRRVDLLAPRLRLTRSVKERWLAILKALFNAEPDQGLTADELAEIPEVGLAVPGDGSSGEASPGELVLRTLHGMVEAGLLASGLRLTVLLRPKGPKNSDALYEALCRLDRAMIDRLAEEEPDADRDTWLELSLRWLNQCLVDQGHRSNPTLLLRLLRSLSEDGKGLAGRQGSLAMVFRSRYRYGVRLYRSWTRLQQLAQRRRTLGRVLLDTLLHLARGEGVERIGGRVLVEIGLEDLTEALKRDLSLQASRDPLAAAERGLLFLHEQGVIEIENGLAVFRQAMSLRLNSDAKGKRFSKGDYRPLEDHFADRLFQIHVMGRYARLGRSAIPDALDFVRDYFQLEKKAFLGSYFAGEETMLQRATDEASYRTLVEDLGNPVQEAVVSAPPESNLLVLAGPGSGKTRVVVHRCAYLLRVQRVPGQAILVLCFNRNAALELRRRLLELVGNDARGVTVLTYHGLAMRLTGTSFATLAQRPPGESLDHDIDFSSLISDALRLLRGEDDIPGLDADELREQIATTYSHILVDEYQDINAEQYELVSALAGRQESDRERRLSLLAVGDDDQNIYGFAGANVEFIRRFERDYEAEAHYLVDCYRSSPPIVAAANRLIALNRDRMKAEQPIRAMPRSGSSDDDAGEVHAVQVADLAAQASCVAEEVVQARGRLGNAGSWGDIAVLARRHEVLDSLRSALEARGVPVAWSQSGKLLPPLHRLREVRQFERRLRGLQRQAVTGHQVEELRREIAGSAGDNPWAELLRDIVDAWRELTGDHPRSPRQFLEHLFESLVERRRDAAIGDGVRLLTAHGAKGLEFDAVVVADGGWDEPDANRLEEERRLFYVAMTRARRQLVLMSRDDTRNPHVVALADAVTEQRPKVEPLPMNIVRRRYGVMSLADLYLSFAGAKPSDHPIHQRLQALVHGDPVTLQPQGERWRIVDLRGEELAALSQQGMQRWGPLHGVIESVRVLAVVERHSEDSAKDYRDRHRVERWEVPVFEVAYRG